ncbi:hypothetical protein F7725_027001, partial [Dissostichus mawsoni]
MASFKLDFLPEMMVDHCSLNSSPVNKLQCRFDMCEPRSFLGFEVNAHVNGSIATAYAYGKKMNGSLDHPDQPDVDAIKMFVGQIPRSWSEEQLRELFEPYGAVYEINVLRDRSQNPPQSKALEAQNALHNMKILPGMHHPIQMKPADSEKNNGCAFVTFTARQMAQSAIKSMHQSQTMELYLQLLQQSASQGNALNNLHPVSGLNAMQNLAALAAAATATQATPTGSSAMTTSSSPLCALTSSGSSPTSSSNSSLNPMASLGALQSLAAGAGAGLNMGSLAGMAALNGSLGSGALSNGSGNTMEALSQAYSGIQQYAAAALPSLYNQSLLSQQSVSAAGSQKEGPEGANLFIYHLPQEFGDQDLLQMFMPFGNVISAKVFIDKQTNLSKCFGFVSYDNPVSSQAAIQSMNGFQIGMKRLKVQLKRSKNDSKPSLPVCLACCCGVTSSSSPCLLLFSDVSNVSPDLVFGIDYQEVVFGCLPFCLSSIPPVGKDCPKK